MKRDRTDRGGGAAKVAEATTEVLAVAAGAALPGVGLLGRKVAELVVEEHSQRVSKALKAAERVSGRTREELDDLILANPETVPMLVKLLSAAGKNGHDRILQAMGAAYARAVINPAALQHEELILMSIESLEDVHIILLAVIESLESAVSTQDLARESGIPEELVRLAGTGLSNAALVETPYGRIGGGEWFEISATGRLVLKAVREAST